MKKAENISSEFKEIMAHILLIESVMCKKSGISNTDINIFLKEIREYIDKTLK